MNILSLETSCDETSIAVLAFTPRQPKLLAHLISSQVKIHAPWGGVVPELAARRHTEVIIPLLKKSLADAKILPNKIDLIAVTTGPGLITALQVGVETARSLAYAWHKPLVGVNHIAGHLISPFLTPKNWQLAGKKSNWPMVALVVSGGHTEIHLVKRPGDWHLLGRTLDDAAGEAFDKTAKLLKLPYPGGPQVAKLANLGNPQAFSFPRPMLNKKNYDFSFAGLKTAVLYALQKIPSSKIDAQLKANICASFQEAAIDVLVNKTLRAADYHGAKTIIVAGGVSANQELKNRFNLLAKNLHNKPGVLFPERPFTGDNAAMIALAAAVEIHKKSLSIYKNSWKNITANANWELW